MSLKSFVRAVRATKTASDERAVIQKESANIRTSFRERPTDHNSRRNNVAKLLYLSFLGVPTHFGQIECVKLLASPKFTDKRLGYLGTMLLLDEAQEVLTLVTNSLQHDLAHSNQFIVGLALCTLGNIAGQEMSRDLCNDIEKLLGSTNSYIRKKAALCAIRIIHKVPELQENFLERSKTLLADRHHGVLLCGVTLATDICQDDADAVDSFRPCVPSLVKILKSLVSSGFAPEHDVTGIADPFLQVKLIRFLGVLGRGDAQISEMANDVLAQVASNTESTKNVGNAILYETVLSILELEADSGLRTLGVNILGKFLANKDNNIRYAALNTLNKVIEMEPNAVQRHRSTILECLRDPDISIRRRALDLSFALINEGNVRVLIRELLAFLEIANNEFKLNMTTQICLAADRYAPNKRWHIDTVLRVLKLAGNFIREEILSSIMTLIASTTELQTYAVQKLYAALSTDIAQEALTIVGTWTIGEYGDLLLTATNFEDEEMVTKIEPEDLIALFDNILHSAFATTIVSGYVITALIKSSARFANGTTIPSIRSILQKHTTSVEVELQQRAIEYLNILEYENMRRGVLERMPAPEIKAENRVLGPVASKPTRHRKKQSEAEDLLDLLGPDESSNSKIEQKPTESRSVDLLEDIFNTPGSSTSLPVTSQKLASQRTDILDLFASSLEPSEVKPASQIELMHANSVTSDSKQKASTTVEMPAYTAFDRSDLLLIIQPYSDSTIKGSVRILAQFRNTGAKIYNLNLQAAVPKSMKLQMQPLASTDIEQNESVSQSMRISFNIGVSILINSLAPLTSQMPIKIRFRVMYSRAGVSGVVTETADCAFSVP